MLEDIFQSMTDAKWNVPVRVDTHRSGPFVFRAGIDIVKLAPFVQRVEDARKLFNQLPKYPEIITRLDHTVLVTGIHGTNTIEGGTESNEEIEKIVALPLEMIKKDSQRRISNLKKAFNIATGFARHVRDISGKSRLILVEEMFTILHHHITDGLEENRLLNNSPGVYRDNPKGFNTKVGDPLHGGVYTAPKCRDDIALLMKEFIEWANSEPIVNLPAIVRAPLVHYYFERIHPFGDGNGRTGRLIESMILKAADFNYANFLISKYYNDNFDKYMTLFNECRKLEEKKDEYPNMPFILFFLEGMRETIVATHDFASNLIARDIFANSVRRLHDSRKINSRQYVIISTLLDRGENDCLLENIRKEPWYQNLYRDRTNKTANRDLKNLESSGLVAVDFNKGILTLRIRG